VADVYDALTTTRSYRGAMSHEQAMEIMRKERGTTFDPALFDVFDRPDTNASCAMRHESTTATQSWRNSTPS